REELGGPGTVGAHGYGGENFRRRRVGPGVGAIAARDQPAHHRRKGEMKRLHATASMVRSGPQSCAPPVNSRPCREKGGSIGVRRATGDQVPSPRFQCPPCRQAFTPAENDSASNCSERPVALGKPKRSMR